VNSDPLLTGADVNYPNQNFSTVPTTWVEDEEKGAIDGLGCAVGPMMWFEHAASARPFLPNGAVNPCVNPFPVGLIVGGSQTDRRTEQIRLGRAGLGVLGYGQTGGMFLGGSPNLNLAGHGVVGSATSDTNSFAGVFGTASGAEAGVRGDSQASTGVVGQSFGTDITRVRSGPGVLGIGPTRTAPPGTAGVGWPGVLGMPAPGNPVGNGVEGRSVRGWAGIFRGNVFVQGNATVTGNKSATVPHPDGSTRALYALESPDSWFEDFGRAELRGGHARVEIDPDYAALVKTNDDYHVFLTPEGDSNGLFVSDRTASRFEVREQQQGTGSLTFSYRIVARRKDVDAERLPAVDVPPPISEEELLTGPGLPIEEPPDEREAWDYPAEWPAPPPGWPVEILPWPPEPPPLEGLEAES
jgi:hypothetical protein